ncbi:MAG: class I SAM-dependent methyltransferase [Deltaproteobacteria bacterium]|nr:class I SAM-dependent methyltransferase [Deltaproteobacteria bacterium]
MRRPYCPAVRARWLDRWLFRHPFEGASARRYAAQERPAFGDLDDRLIDDWAPELRAARRAVDVGAGPATLPTRLVERHPALSITCVEPSRDLARRRPGFATVRAVAEDLPFRDGQFDVAWCLSSIRHVRDRQRTFSELRRVIRPGGTLWIVELDPDADRTRCNQHARGLGSPALRLAFRPLVVRTAPTAGEIAALAVAAGWRVTETRADRLQPVYIITLRA